MLRLEKLNTDKRGRPGRAIVFIIFALLLTSVISGHSRSFYQHPPADYDSPFRLHSGNYVVIGVFRHFENAVRYSDFVFRKGYTTRYGYYPLRGYYYVYLNVYDTYESAQNACLGYRADNEFKRAWVFTINADYRPEYEEAFVVEDATEPPVIQEEAPAAEQVATEQASYAVVSETVENIISDGPAHSYPFYFNAYDVRSHKPVDATIRIVDPADQQVISETSANSSEVVEGLETQSLVLISDHFGYRKVQHEVDLDNLEGSGADVRRRGDTIVVNFELVRLKAGDIVTMYNVYFFNNSAVMRPESRFEINQLLQMLQENENYRIAIHGHTNGNGYGPIIKMDKDDTNFFQLSRNNKEGKGSAKALSKQRALTIQRYLEHQGIDAKRTKIRGWGGKKMIYEPTNARAKNNVRVEIEILQE